MTTAIQELLQIADDLDRLAARAGQEEIQRPLEQLKQAAEEVSKAWSGSWIGYHGNVYYRNFQRPPPGSYFSQEWGLGNTLFAPSSVGDWVEYHPDEVEEGIYSLAGNPDLKSGEVLNDEASDVFEKRRLTLLSLVDVELNRSSSTFLSDMKEKATRQSLVTATDFIRSWAPDEVASRDSRAIYGNHQAPAHVAVLAMISAIRHTTESLKELGELSRQIAGHLSRTESQDMRTIPTEERVFIGHGRSPIWRELQDFVQDRLGLQVDEFNRVPAAGLPTTGRLSEMMDSVGMAFLVMTGEDDQPDGQFRARENVVHEAGLFQGRLGFTRAIILLEDGCAEFSNIAGLGQIRFPKGNVKSAFEEIRMVLEREGLLSR